MRPLRTIGHALMLLSGMLFIACSGGGGGGGGTVNSYNVNLASLEISDGTLSPIFDQTVTGYSVDVANDVESVTVTPSTVDEAATLTVNGSPIDSGDESDPIALTSGAVTTITIRVTAPDNITAKDYNVAVKRQGSVTPANVNLASLSISKGSLSPAFGQDTILYTASVSYSVPSVTVTASPADSAASLTVNGVALTAGAPSAPVTLAANSVTTITVQVKGRDESSTKDYSIAVTRGAPSTEADLSDLSVSEGSLSPAFASGTSNYAVSVPFSVASIKITPVAEHDSATITVDSAPVVSGSPVTVSLAPNAVTTVTISVTAEDGISSKDYTISITRAAGNANASLSGISLSAGTLTPAFNPNTTFYRSELGSAVESVTLTPETAYSATTVTVNNQPVDSGSSSSAIPLSVGINKVLVNTMAEDGQTKKSYYLELVRVPDKSKNAYLSDLYLSAGRLSPVFAKNITSYTAEVASGVSSITVTPSVPGVNAVCRVNGTVVASQSASGAITLATGVNTITVEVIAEDPSSSMKYTVTVNRLVATSANADLAGLTASGGTLSPVFDPAITSYTVYTNGTVYTLTPVSAGAGSVISVNGTTVASGTEGPVLGNITNASVVVTAANGAEKTYTITASADVTAPVLGALTVQKRETRYLNIAWSAATDDQSGSSDISYAVYRSNSNNISTIASAEANGTLVWNYTRNMLISNTPGLSPDTTYYFAVIAKDLAGNKTIASLDAATSKVSVFNSAVPNYQVYSVVEDNGIVYLGGEFTSIGKRAVRSAIVTKSTGIPIDTNVPETNDYVKIAIPDGEGGWYIGGSFTSVNGIPRNYIAHVFANGLVDAWNPNANNMVLTLVVRGGVVYAGGTFTSVGGLARNRIAALDAEKGTVTAWDPNVVNGGVQALVTKDGVMYVGGSFTSIGGQTRNHIAALDVATGNATAWNPNANFDVITIAISGGVVYAGGNFTSIGGQTRNRIASLDLVTGNASAWNPNASGNVLSLDVNGGTVYAGGSFTSIGGQTRKCIAALDVATGNATAWNPDANGLVRTLAVSDGVVYTGGDFTSIGGQTRNCLAAVEVGTGNATPWNPNPNGTVSTLAVTGGDVYVGGGSAQLAVSCGTVLPHWMLLPARLRHGIRTQVVVFLLLLLKTARSMREVVLRP